MRVEITHTCTNKQNISHKRRHLSDSSESTWASIVHRLGNKMKREIKDTTKLDDCWVATVMQGHCHDN